MLRAEFRRIIRLLISPLLLRVPTKFEVDTCSSWREGASVNPTHRPYLARVVGTLIGFVTFDDVTGWVHIRWRVAYFRGAVYGVFN